MLPNEIALNGEFWDMGVVNMGVVDMGAEDIGVVDMRVKEVLQLSRNGLFLSEEHQVGLLELYPAGHSLRGESLVHMVELR
ncbi:unnamed protein product [Calypogeia fissa]